MDAVNVDLDEMRARVDATHSIITSRQRVEVGKCPSQGVPMLKWFTAWWFQAFLPYIPYIHTLFGGFKHGF